MFKDLEGQLNRFIKSGFKYSRFTNDLYEMLYIDSNVFIAHFNKEGFYKVRFQEEAEQTIDSLAVVKKVGINHLCHLLAAAMELRLHPEVFVKRNTSVVLMRGAK